MQAETQAYLDGVKTPTIIAPGGPGGIAQAQKVFAKINGRAMQQVAIWLTLLQDSEVVETDAELVALYEGQTQAFGALQRELANHHRAARAVHDIMQRLKANDAEMRLKAQAAGYTI